MGEIVVLGSGAAITDENHKHTHLFFREGAAGLLVDCGSDPVIHLPKAGIEINSITDILFTHFHPDHISGAPLLLMDMWLLGRKTPLNLYGLQHTLDCLEALMDMYNWRKWPDFYPIHFHRLPEESMTTMMENEAFRVITSPVKHMVPTVGVRVEFFAQNTVAAYSCDTEPCPQVVQLAAGADVLLHESFGEGLGHSSSAQAAEIAAEAGTKKLYLIHYDALAGETAQAEMIADAKAAFPGEVCLAEDLMVIPVG